MDQRIELLPKGTTTGGKDECIVEECTNVQYCRGACRKHYDRARQQSGHRKGKPRPRA